MEREGEIDEVNEYREKEKHPRSPSLYLSCTTSLELPYTQAHIVLTNKRYVNMRKRKSMTSFYYINAIIYHIISIPLRSEKYISKSTKST